MQLGQYVFERLKAYGVDHVFGIPGDFALPLYAALEKSPLTAVGMTHEPSVGYAADVYGRLRGMGVALVTFGAGALNMVNPVAMAYAEESPLLVLSGAPDVHWQQTDMLFHHRVKSPSSQIKVFREVTCAQATIISLDDAQEQIDRVLATMVRFSRPGYLEIARDLVFQELPGKSKPATLETSIGTDQEVLQEATEDVVAMLNRSDNPVLYAGVEVERFELRDQLRQLAEKMNVPVATSLMGKGVLPENHPNFAGTYFGRMGNPGVGDLLRDSDCIVALGMLLTDVDVGFDPEVFRPRGMIQATAEGLKVRNHAYPGLHLKELMEALLKADDLKKHNAEIPSIEAPVPGDLCGPLTTRKVLHHLNEFFTADDVAISDTGDCLFMSVDLCVPLFVGPGYYASMGLAVPGAVGAACAREDLRPVVLVGDGAFQMTGMELATAVSLKQKPIIILLNNGCYATLEAIDQPRSYYDIPVWDYPSVAKALGARALSCSTGESFAEALATARKSDEAFLIEALIPKEEISLTLAAMGKEYGKKIKTQ